jgi:hypothetical protein
MATIATDVATLKTDVGALKTTMKEFRASSDARCHPPTNLPNDNVLTLHQNRFALHEARIHNAKARPFEPLVWPLNAARDELPGKVTEHGVSMLALAQLPGNVLDHLLAYYELPIPATKVAKAQALVQHLGASN